MLWRMRPELSSQASGISRHDFLAASSTVVLAGTGFHRGRLAKTSGLVMMWILFFAIANGQAQQSANKRQPADELRVHPENPRYFVDCGRPVLLMGRYHADFICSTSEHFTRDLPGYMHYLADELNANFTQVWAIMIFSGRKEAEYGVDTGGARYIPFLRTGPGTHYYGEPKYDLARSDPPAESRLGVAPAAT